MSSQSSLDRAINYECANDSKDTRDFGAGSPDRRSDEHTCSNARPDSDDLAEPRLDDSDDDSKDETSEARSSDEYEDTDLWEETEYPPLDLNYEALKHTARYFLQGGHGRCTKITVRTRGGYHEIRQLHFEDGWSCIGRFTRDKLENFSATESGYATMEYVRRHTSIPVPRIYLANYDPTNPVGAPFVLMERMPGHSLSKLWPMLRTPARHAVLSQLADVISQLAQLKFNQIGSITSSGLGPCQSAAVPNYEAGKGPFYKCKDFVMEFLRADNSPEMAALLCEICSELASYLDKLSLPSVEAPYRLIHGDFDEQNLMFTWDSPTAMPVLSAVIDWDFSWVGPVYFLYEYPPMILDDDSEDHLYEENKDLRKRFVQTLAHRFPNGCQREEVKQSFRDKNFVLTYAEGYFVSRRWSDAEAELRMKRYFLDQVRIANYGAKDSDEIWHPYGGRHDWEPDSELESEGEA